MKAAKLKVKKFERRGRPCKIDAARNDNGRISRAQNPERSAALDARDTRVRLFGVKEEDALQPESGTVIGRLKLSGELSLVQYEALVRFVAQHEIYMKAINAPDSLAAPGTGSRSAASDEADTEWRVATEQRYKNARKAIREAQNHLNGNLYAAIDYLGFRNEFHSHMVGDIRIVGNVLVRHYGLTQ